MNPGPRKGQSIRRNGKVVLPVAAHSLEAFVCIPLGGVRVTRRACGLRHKAEKAARGAISACGGCPTGAAHAAGRKPSSWKDGAPIEQAVLRTH